MLGQFPESTEDREKGKLSCPAALSDAPSLSDCICRTVREIQSFAGAEKDARVVGEIAFQLDRRILAYVFPGVTRLYGFTVANIPEKIKQVRPAGSAAGGGGRSGVRGAPLPVSAPALAVAAEGTPGPRRAGRGPEAALPQTSIKSLDGSVDEKQLRELTQRYLALSARLEKLGYSRDVHPAFSEFLINTYGILKQRPDLRSNPLHSSPTALRKLVIDVVPPKFLGDSLLLLNCLRPRLHLFAPAGPRPPRELAEGKGRVPRAREAERAPLPPPRGPRRPSLKSPVSLSALTSGSRRAWRAPGPRRSPKEPPRQRPRPSFPVPGGRGGLSQRGFPDEAGAKIWFWRRVARSCRQLGNAAPCSKAKNSKGQQQSVMVKPGRGLRR
ncbi:hypothetical protein P7K49_032359 [Saguinus oedipus]|uniref:Speriolin C-terminal domain-containing protein n=1 Tax=Saguinus oedipus TaxID=9490 RepID=A0ABQ9TZ87_SAGOE|nr:hypothetical protein P7K49_032359 [Saguinus oedipus]